MIIADEWLLAGMTSVAAYFGWMLRYMTVEIRTVISENTKVLTQLSVIMSECPKKEGK